MLLLALMTGVAIGYFAAFGTINQLAAERDMYRIYAHEPEMRPGQTHYMTSDNFFDANGCMMDGWFSTDDLPCLDPDNTGCVTRASWYEFNNFWMHNIPEPEIGLCEQKLRIINNR